LQISEHADKREKNKKRMQVTGLWIT